LERAFAEFDLADGHPDCDPRYGQDWGRVSASARLSDAKSLNDFSDLIPSGKFPPLSHFIIFCTLYVYGSKAVEYWQELREYYCRGKPRGSHAASDEALDLWYAVDAWLQSWLYSPSDCQRPSTNSPPEWLRCIGSKDPTPHLRMSHLFLLRAGFELPVNYSTARRNLFDIKGVFYNSAIVENGTMLRSIDALLVRFPLIGWDIFQRAVYLLTNDIKPPSHFPIFGWREQRVHDYVRRGRLLLDVETEAALLGTPQSLHGLLWPQQLETLRKIASVSRVTVKKGGPITSGRGFRRTSAH
jgi:hypothetical protein